MLIQFDADTKLGTTAGQGNLGFTDSTPKGKGSKLGSKVSFLFPHMCWHCLTQQPDLEW